MHKLGTFLFVFLLSLVYLVSFCQIWAGVFTPSLYVYIGVFLVLLFLSYMFLHGAYYITHIGKKIEAEILPLKGMDANEFRAYFKRKIEELNENLVCLAKYEIDGKICYEIVGINKLYGIVPKNRIDIYIIAHKSGIKTDYEVRTKADVIRNICIGMPFAIALLGWFLLFVKCGI